MSFVSRRRGTEATGIGVGKFCKEAVRGTIERFGKLDILVNNAAFQEHAAKHRATGNRQYRGNLNCTGTLP